MKIYNQIDLKLNEETGKYETVNEDSFEYEGKDLVVAGGFDPVSFVISIILSMALQFISQLFYKEPKLEEPDKVGFKTNTRTTSEPLRIVYGKQRVGGNDVFGTTVGVHNRNLYVVQSLSEGKCEGIDTDDGNPLIYIDDKLRHEFNNYANIIGYTFHAGGNNQVVDSTIQTADATWEDPLRNTSYVAWHFTWDENQFRGLPTREVVLKGLLVTDVQSRAASASWSDNPVDCLHDFFTNDRYGLGISTSKINYESWASAASYCDTKGFTCNMVVQLNQQDSWSVVQNMLNLFRGTITWFDGRYYLYYADMNYESSVKTIEDEHIEQSGDGKANIRLSQPSRFETPSALRVSFIDKDKGYTDDSILIGDTNGLVEDFNLVGCTDREMASNLGTSMLERKRLNRSITGSFSDDCIELEPHDLITLNTTALAIGDQTMRVVSTNISDQGIVNLTLQYEDSDLYDDDYDVNITDTYQVTLPDPSEKSSITNATVSEETYYYRLRTFVRLNIDFTVDEDEVWFKYAECWLSTTTDTPSAYRMVGRYTSSFSIDPVEEGVTYWIILRTVNIWGARQDLDEGTKLSQTVQGDNDAPSSISFLTAVPGDGNVKLISDKLLDPDIEIYEFRQGSQWNGGLFLSSKRAPVEIIEGIKPGDFTFSCNTRATNGIYGDTPQIASVTIPQPKGWSLYTTFNDNFASASAVFNNTVRTLYSGDYALTCLNGNLVSGGNMELDTGWKGSTYWSSYGSPTVNERNATEAYTGTYSRKFTVDAQYEGIFNNNYRFKVLNGVEYTYSFRVYPDDTQNLNFRIRNGNNTSWIETNNLTTLTQDDWNIVTGTYTEDTGGNDAWLAFRSPTGQTSGTWYIDDVKLRPTTGYSTSGSYISPVFDTGITADTYYVYVLSDITVTGVGSTWNDVIPFGTTWNDINIGSRTWNEIFQVEEAPEIDMQIRYKKEIGNDWSVIKNAEILSGVVEARYFQVVIKINNPSEEINAIIDRYTLTLLN